MAPPTIEGTPLQENSRTDAWSIMDSISFDVENLSSDGYSRPHIQVAAIMAAKITSITTSDAEILAREQR